MAAAIHAPAPLLSRPINTQHAMSGANESQGSKPSGGVAKDDTVLDDSHDTWDIMAQHHQCPSIGPFSLRCLYAPFPEMKIPYNMSPHLFPPICPVLFPPLVARHLLLSPAGNEAAGVVLASQSAQGCRHAAN